MHSHGIRDERNEDYFVHDSQAVSTRSVATLQAPPYGGVGANAKAWHAPHPQVLSMIHVVLHLSPRTLILQL